MKDPFLVEPSKATSEQKEAMKFFLNVALASVDPAIGKKSLGTAGLTHIIAFGDLWPAEVATAMLQVQHWSDTTNLAHNIAIASDTDKKKKRKPVHDKKTRSDIEHNTYYELEEELRGVYGLPGNEARMAAWDEFCCSGRGRKRARGPADRVNTVPSNHRQSPDGSKFTSFIKRNKRFSNIYTPMPALPGDGTQALKFENNSQEVGKLNIDTMQLKNGEKIEVTQM